MAGGCTVHWKIQGADRRKVILMSNSYLSLYQTDEEPAREGPFSALATRAALIERCVSNAEFDLVVIGGGLEATLIAHAGSLAELRVLVLAEGGIGNERSEWDDQLRSVLKSNPLTALRSLAAIRACVRTFPYKHLWSSADGVDSIRSGFLSKVALWAISQVARTLTIPQGLLNLNVNLLTREVALAARQEGACVLSGIGDLYLEAESETGCYRVGFTDCISGQKCDVRVGGVVLDPSLDELPPTRIGTRVKRFESTPRKVISSRCAVREESGIFSIQRRGAWDALLGSRQVVTAVLKAGSRYQKPLSGATARVARRLPGCVSVSELERFRGRALSRGVSPDTVEKVINRWAGRVRYLAEADPDAFEEISSGVLRGEVELAVMSDHAATVREVVENSLGLSLSDVSEAGLAAIKQRLSAVMEDVSIHK